IIEVNWADLKGFPASRFGLLLYVLKIFIAMWQISSTGWRENSSGQAGPLWPGRVLHVYFAAFGIALTPVSIMIMFAFISSAQTALLVIVGIAALLTVTLLWLRKFDRLMLAGLAVTAAGLMASLCIIFFPHLREEIVVGAVRAARIVQTLAVVALVCAIASLVWRKYRYGRKEGDTWTTFVSRSALLILPFAIITGGYGAVVAAVGYYSAGKLSEYGLIDTEAIKLVGDLY